MFGLDRQRGLNVTKRSALHESKTRGGYPADLLLDSISVANSISLSRARARDARKRECPAGLCICERIPQMIGACSVRSGLMQICSIDFKLHQSRPD